MVLIVSLQPRSQGLDPRSTIKTLGTRLVSLIFTITGLNENNEQFGKNVVVGHPKPHRSFSISHKPSHEALNISDTIKSLRPQCNALRMINKGSGLLK